MLNDQEVEVLKTIKAESETVKNVEREHQGKQKMQPLK